MFKMKKTRYISRVFVVLMATMLLITTLPSALITVEAVGYSTDELAEKALQANYINYRTGTPVDASWGNFSSYDFYVMAKAGITFDSWSYEGASLFSSINTLMADTINKEGETVKASAKRVVQDLLLAKTLGDEARVTSLTKILENRLTAAGELDEGLYAIFSNMPAFDLLAREDLYQDMNLDVDAIVNYILAEQDTNGAWPKANVENYMTNDFLSTAEGIRTLAQLKDTTSVDVSRIEEAIDQGLTWLKSKQLENGAYVTGYDDAVIDTSEMIHTAYVLGIEPRTLTHSSGKSPLDFMMYNAYTGQDFGNAASNTWALDAYLQLGARLDLASSLGSFDGLLLKGIRNNYASYINGTAVSGNWGDFGSYDIYQLAKTGVDIKSWEYGNSQLIDAINGLLDDSLSKENQGDKKATAKRLAQDFLLAKEMGETTKAENLLDILEERQKESGEFDSGDYSIYSNLSAYDLLLREDAIKGSSIDINSIVNYILSSQDETGAWPIADASNWITNDFLATNEALRTLAQLKDNSSVDAKLVQSAIDKALSWLEDLQEVDGGFVTAYDDKVVDTASLIYTAKVLDLNLESWLSSEGNTAIDFMKNSALVDGSFGNVASTTYAIDAFNQLGAMVANDSVLAISIEPSSAKLKVDESQQFSALVKKVNASDEIITNKTSWNVSDQEKASINEAGLLKAKADGLVKVVTSYQFDITTSAAITIDVKNTSSNVDETATIKINLAVIGKNGDLIYGPKNLNVSSKDTYKMTAMGALDASSLKWKFSNDFPDLVESIDGIKNQGLTGWMYSVNGSIPNVVASDKTIKTNDRVLWWFSEEAMGSSPDWPSSSTSSSTTSSSSPDDASSDLPIDSTEVIPEFISQNRLNLNKRLSFNDVKANYSWALDAIEILAGNDIIIGTGNGFEPARSMTRAEFVKIVVEALELKNKSMMVTKFKDLSHVDWFYDYIQVGVANQLLVGYADHSIRPNDTISRYEVAVILNRLELDKNNRENALNFLDSNEVPDWAKASVGFVEENKIMQGYNQNFNGNVPLTRAEAALVVYRYLNYKLQ